MGCLCPRKMFRLTASDRFWTAEIVECGKQEPCAGVDRRGEPSTMLPWKESVKGVFVGRIRGKEGRRKIGKNYCLRQQEYGSSKQKTRGLGVWLLGIYVCTRRHALDTFWLPAFHCFPQVAELPCGWHAGWLLTINLYCFANHLSTIYTTSH